MSVWNKNFIVKGAPFKSKSECAKVIQINRSTVAAYLDK